jgi:hypothetical protein
MVEIFLCCSPADREVAAAIAARLERGAGVTVTLDDGGTESVAVQWKWGDSAAAILLLLSPESVPLRAGRSDWGELLDHIGSNARPPVASALVRECGYPRLLERKRFFRWDAGPRDALRAIEKWALQLYSLPERRSFTPARLPWFEGREKELDRLWETLVDEAGTAVVVNPAAGSGKTSLAQEFSRQAGEHFRDVLWVACGGRSPASIVADLADQLGVDCEGDAGEAFAALARTAGGHRLLLVLDDAPPSLAVPVAEGRASVLVTTRSTQIETPRAARIMRLEAAPEFRPAVPDNPVDRRLWRAMAACHSSAIPLGLAARIAGIEPAEAAEACERLIEGRLVDPFDWGNGRLRLPSQSIAAAGGLEEDERRRHAEAIDELASRPSASADFRQCTDEILPAFRWLAEADWERASAFGRRASALLGRCGRLAEGAELLAAVRNAADQRGDWEASDACSWELSWIRGVPYRGARWKPEREDQLSLDFGG